jgi:transcription-repair coupling factor (superfamily II helicase)
MKNLSELIRRDREFGASIDSIRAQLKSEKPLPVIINGLAGGALYAYAVEAAETLCHTSPVLVLAGSEAACDALCSIFNERGVRSAVYKQRELIFHNVSASHDNERERLSVLMSLASGELDAVITTPDAAVGATVPYGVLTSLVTTLKIGLEISPDELCEKLVTLGFIRCDSVESAGQFAKRGGIVDFAPS